MFAKRLVAAALLAWAVPASCQAHALAPSLLELRETGVGIVDVRWRTPVVRAPGSDLAPLLPAHCSVIAAPEPTARESVLEARWTLRCSDESLVGSRIGAQGIAASGADVLLRIELADGRSFQSVLTAERSDFLVPTRQSRFEVASAFGRLGFGHILSGWDHLMFVLGLVLLVRGRRSLALGIGRSLALGIGRSLTLGIGRSLTLTITSFTVGHSITLSLAVLGFVHVPQQPAEAAIAFSILVLAGELARGAEEGSSVLRRYPWAMALAFGLLHGLGFAGALTEAGLPAGEVPLALAAFNVGIEAGQPAFVLVLLGVISAIGRAPWRWPVPATMVPGYVMGSCAAFWMFERTAAFLR